MSQTKSQVTILGDIKSNQDAYIWRYMDLAKFIDLVSKKKLYLTRVKSYKGDQLEGRIPKAGLEKQCKVWLDQYLTNPDLKPLKDLLLANLQPYYDKLLNSAYVSCWHMNMQESTAMWSEYISSGEGVAIRTTVGRLVKGIGDCSGTFLSLVKYVNHRTYTPALDEIVAPCLLKRLSFKHEEEVRLFTYDVESLLDSVMKSGHEFAPGVSFDVDTEHLLESVYVCPGSADYQREAVQSVLNAFGLNQQVAKRSDLDELPT